MARAKRKGIVKFTGGKKKLYTNLSVFNSECSSRGVRGNVCELKALRCKATGGGIATVQSKAGAIKGRARGTWRLHFASCRVLVKHLKKRVIDKTGLLTLYAKW